MVSRVPLVVALAALFSVAGPARAGDGDPARDDELAGLTLEELLDTPIVAATGYQQRASAAPSSVTVITGEEIRQLGHRTLNDVLRSMRGVYVVDDRNYGYTGMRGFLLPGDYNSRVLLLIDGRRINDVVYGYAPVGLDFPLSIDDIARVELIRGPGSAVHGSNAFFAVINVITVDGRGQRGLRATAEGGALAPTLGSPADDRRLLPRAVRGSLSYGDRFLSDELGLYLSGSFHLHGGQPELYFPEFDGATDATCVDHLSLAEIPCDGIARSNDGEVVATAFAKARFRGFTLSGGALHRDKEVATAAFQTIFNDPAFHTIDEHGFVDLEYEGDLTERLELRARVFFHHYYYRADYPYDVREEADEGAPLGGFRVINRDQTTAQTVGTTAQVTHRLRRPGRAVDRLVTSLGVDAENRFEQHPRNFDLGGAVYLDDDRSSIVLGAFGQLEARVLRRLRLHAGGRLDYHADSFGLAASPRIAAVYSPVDQTHLKALYGTSFRAPSHYERFYSGPLYLPSPDLEPERIRTVEGIAERFLDDDVRLLVAGYWYRIDDLIVQELNQEGLARFVNQSGHVTARGVEFEFEGRWDQVRARMSYGWQRAEDDDGERLVNSPRQLVKLAIIAPLGAGVVGAYEGLLTDERTSVRGAEIEARFVSNLKLTRADIAPGLTASLSVRNLFDVAYADPGSRDHRQERIPQERRTLWLALTYAP